MTRLVIDPDRVLTALDMADNLMADDPISLKRGYTRENAVLAVIDYLDLDQDEAAMVSRISAKKHGGER